jgi:NAD(P)-dependent dehydrogenase (short-subunit alcohol dehydrogenase family)
MESTPKRDALNAARSLIQERTMSVKKTAIITGASGGIGKGLVEAFLGSGHNVVATSHDPGRTLTASPDLLLVSGDITKLET